jgi:hypothetical protein
MKKPNRVLLVAVLGLALTARAQDSNVLRAAMERVEVEAKQAESVRKAFRELERPFDVRTIVDRPSTIRRYDTSSAHIELRGKARIFVDTTGANELIVALWPYLDDPQYDADACMCLLSKLKTPISAAYPLAKSADNLKKHWPQERKSMVSMSKGAARGALGQPDWWYPHPVLFDRVAVLTESKTNAPARANYIAAMRKALEDPKIRTENPLGVHETLSALSALHATEAAQSYVDYLLFDRRTGKDFRLTTTNIVQLIDFTDSLPMEACLPQLKLNATPLVLTRIANATPEEMSCEVGGGGLPLLSINYFWLMHIREEQAIETVEGFKRNHQEMAESQIANLDVILDAVKAKKHRQFWMDGSDWAAPKTNAPASKP